MYLPEQFGDLEVFVAAWDHPGTNERYAARLASTLPEMKAFFDAVLPLAEDIKSYLNALELDAFDEQDQCLARLMFAFAIVASAVEIYRQPMVPDSGATEFDMVVEPELGGK